MKRLFKLVIVGILVTQLSCNDDESTSLILLPDNFKIIGSAIGIDADLNIDCLCDLIVEIDSTNVDPSGNVIYQGVHGGHFSRKVLDQSGAGIALAPDVFGEILIQQFGDGTIELIFPINNNTGSRFWDSVGLFKGSFNADEISGNWTCAPFDTREDSVGIVSGKWEVVPQ